MTVTVFWRALYTAGHDAACLSQRADGWSLEGTAVYLRDGEPAAIRYALDLAPDWGTRHGSVDGVVGGKPLRQRIERDEAGWLLDARRQNGLEDAVDLDFGFTPATNHPQLRRMALEVGQSERITVAWMYVGSPALEPLPQIYRRTSERTYDYDSPQGPYRATLHIARSGFVSLYPDLWRIETPEQ
jgi:hypothetical protein